MGKTGRNDACPCGSGKKYKKCCLDKDGLTPGPVHISGAFAHLLTYEEVAAMSAEDIIQQLNGYGIAFAEDAFLKDTEEYCSAEDLSENWWRVFSVTAKGKYGDFPRLAAWILWERLVPSHNKPAERIMGMIDDGYRLLEMRDAVGGCDALLAAWEAVKYRCRPGSCSLDHLDQLYRRSFFVSNLVQDIEAELHNAGRENPAYFRKRIDYCRELLRYFPDADDLIIHNTRRAIADSYASLGEVEQAESEFQKLVDEYPGNPWGYIAWGDIFSFRKRVDYSRARALYAKALAIAADESDIEVINDRLNDLPNAPQA